MHRRFLHATLAVLLLFPACGKTQEKAATGVTPSPDSLRHIEQRAELKQQLTRSLEATTQEAAATDARDDISRMIASEHHLFRTLAVLTRALDRDGSAANDITEEERRFRADDSARTGKAARIMNGIAGVYAMYAILYQMEFGNDEARMARLGAMRDSVAAVMKPSIEAIDAASVISDKIFQMSRAIVGRILPDSVFGDSFDQIDQQYAEGRKAAESPEDRFLNALYRNFETMQLWAYAVDPRGKKEIGDLFRSLIADVSQRENITAQIAVTMQYVYTITDYVTRKIVAQTL